MSMHEPEWTPSDDERQALERWTVREPPRGVAARVAATHTMRRRKRRVLAGGAVLMAALAAGLIAVGSWVAFGPGTASDKPIPVAVGGGDGRVALGVSVQGASLPKGMDVVVANLIASGLAKDEALGWKIYAAQLHSDESYPRALSRWRRFNYAALRRKVKLYVGDLAKPQIRIEDTAEGDRDIVTIKVFNRGNPNLPTPCHLRKDPKAGGAWKVVRCSL